MRYAGEGALKAPLLGFSPLAGASSWGVLCHRPPDAVGSALEPPGARGLLPLVCAPGRQQLGGIGAVAATFVRRAHPGGARLQPVGAARPDDAGRSGHRRLLHGAGRAGPWPVQSAGRGGAGRD
eukprot:scaffold6142_cov110-Isochrysis_galbana.AAC.2